MLTRFPSGRQTAFSKTGMGRSSEKPNGMQIGRSVSEGGMSPERENAFTNSDAEQNWYARLGRMPRVGLADVQEVHLELPEAVEAGSSNFSVNRFRIMAYFLPVFPPATLCILFASMVAWCAIFRMISRSCGMVFAYRCRVGLESSQVWKPLTEFLDDALSNVVSEKQDEGAST